MISLGVIGLGTIFTTQIEALKLQKENYRLVAVCDCNPVKIKNFMEKIAAKTDILPCVYLSSDELLQNAEVEAVLIATPPDTHFDLAGRAMRYGKNVLLEKPAVVNLEQLHQLYRVAEENRVLLHIAYHAAFAQDLEWFLSHQGELGFGKLTGIDCGFYDPYMIDGEVMPAKRSLGGSFLDSGVNALSVCARLVDLSNFTLAERTLQRETGFFHMVCHGECSYKSATCNIMIRTGWDLKLDQKTTLLTFDGLKGYLLLDHSNQRVVLTRDGVETVLYVYAEDQRLLTHYKGVFQDFANATKTRHTNQAQSLEIHRLLL